MTWSVCASKSSKPTTWPDTSSGHWPARWASRPAELIVTWL
jgi:hypothetical protein